MHLTYLTPYNIISWWPSPNMSETNPFSDRDAFGYHCSVGGFQPPENDLSLSICIVIRFLWHLKPPAALWYWISVRIFKHKNLGMYRESTFGGPNPVQTSKHTVQDSNQQKWSRVVIECETCSKLLNNFVFLYFHVCPYEREQIVAR